METASNLDDKGKMRSVGKLQSSNLSRSILDKFSLTLLPFTMGEKSKISAKNMESLWGCLAGGKRTKPKYKPNMIGRGH